MATGYGYASFWGSSAIQNLPEGKEWAGFAAHSHNGYLDTALGMGVPGLPLLILVLVILPLRNFQRAERGRQQRPLAMMLLRIWLFGLYLSAMESFSLDLSDPLWFTFLLAVFGLHYLARFRTAASRPHTGISSMLRLAPECRPHRFGDILPPAVEIERQVHRRPFDHGGDPVGIGLVVSTARHQHDGAAADQFLEARMMIEFLGQVGPVTISGRPDCTQVRMLERRAVSPSSSG